MECVLSTAKVYNGGSAFYCGGLEIKSLCDFEKRRHDCPLIEIKD
jgi:hypothetical protein